MTKKLIMGLDASTSTIGLTILKYQDGYLSLDHIEYYKPPKKGNLFEKLAAVRQYIIDKLIEFQPDYTALEDIILFIPGKSSAITITSLAQLNRTVGLAIYNQTGKPPELLDVNRIRRAIKLEKKQPKKPQIPETIEKHLDIKFPYVYITRGKNKGKIAEESYDEADSCAVALAYYKLFIENKVK